MTSTTTTSTTIATATFNAGLTYYQFDASQYNDDGYVQDINVATFQNTNYQRTGLIQNLASIATPNWPNGGTYCALPGYSSFNCANIAVVMQGYFVAPSSGNYTFDALHTTDNDFYAWFNEDAEGTAWNNGNTAFEEQYPAFGGSASYELDAGEYLPLTFLWVNVGGPGQVIFQVTMADGSVVADTTGLFVPSVGCDGSTVFSP